MKTHIAIQDARYTKTYATFDACVKAADALIVKYKTTGGVYAESINPRFIVSVDQATGRFYAVFVQTGADALYFAHNKFLVCG